MRHVLRWDVKQNSVERAGTEFVTTKDTEHTKKDRKMADRKTGLIQANEISTGGVLRARANRFDGGG
jgi:hypothetical protein